MDPMRRLSACIKLEPEENPDEGSPTSHCDASMQCGIVNQEAIDVPAIKCEPRTLEDNILEIEYMNSDVDVVKSESETILQEGSPPSHRDAIMQCVIVKQEIEDVSTIKFELGTVATGENVQKCGASSEIDISFQDVKNECLVRNEKNNTSRGNINMESIHIKAEPGPLVQDADACTDVVEELKVVKIEFLGRSDNINHTADLITELKPHPVKKAFSCSHCNYSDSRKSILARHLRTHTGEKPYSCPLCNYAFSQKGNLKHHLLIHSGGKPFSCSLCNFSCSRKQQLNNHILAHSRVKPFSCSFCNFSCSQKGNLKHHMLTHSGDKPFSCSLCNYSCSLKRNLNQHVMTHSGKKPFSCCDCNYSSYQKGNLKTHMLKIHLRRF